MSGLGSGVCGFLGCDNPIPRDEDFCCSGCEEACRDEDADVDELADLRDDWDEAMRNIASNALSMDPECSLCEAGHVPVRPCGPEPCEDCGSVVYPHTHFDEDVGCWVEMASRYHGRIVPRVEPGF